MALPLIPIALAAGAAYLLFGKSGSPGSALAPAGQGSTSPTLPTPGGGGGSSSGIGGGGSGGGSGCCWQAW